MDVCSVLFTNADAIRQKSHLIHYDYVMSIRGSTFAVEKLHTTKRCQAHHCVGNFSIFNGLVWSMELNRPASPPHHTGTTHHEIFSKLLKRNKTPGKLMKCPTMHSYIIIIIYLHLVRNESHGAKEHACGCVCALVSHMSSSSVWQ